MNRSVDFQTGRTSKTGPDKRTEGREGVKNGQKGAKKAGQRAGQSAVKKAGGKAGLKPGSGAPQKASGKKKASGGFSHPEYDAAVLDCFLKKQLQLFPEVVATTPEEAADFLEMCFAVVARSKREVRMYFEEVGTDVEGEDLLSAAEVFPVGDGRYLIVEG